jgi:hypothetical protein
VKIVNLTPHDVHVLVDEGVVRIIGRSGKVARVKQTTRPAGKLDGTIPLTETESGAIEGLPRPRPGVVYLVSQVLAQAARSRTDLVFPGEAVRDAEGRVVATKGLTRFAARTKRRGKPERSVPKPAARRIRRSFHRSR